MPSQLPALGLEVNGHSHRTWMFCSLHIAIIIYMMARMRIFVDLLAQDRELWRMPVPASPYSNATGSVSVTSLIKSESLVPTPTLSTPAQCPAELWLGVSLILWLLSLNAECKISSMLQSSTKWYATIFVGNYLAESTSAPWLAWLCRILLRRIGKIKNSLMWGKS